MYEMLIDFFLCRPGRVSVVGRALFQLGGLTLLVGLCGRIATVGAPVIKGLAGSMSSYTSLALLYPSLPTWWVPESFIGYGACVLAALIGLTLVQMGTLLDRAIR